MRDKLKADLLAIIGNVKNGINFSKIAEHAEISSITVSKYCHVLAAENKVVIEKWGDMKIVKLAKGGSKK